MFEMNKLFQMTNFNSPLLIRLGILFTMTLVLSACSKSVNKVMTESVVNQYEQNPEIEKILTFQAELNKKYSNPSTSPLSKSQIEVLKENGGHNFFDVNSQLRITAYFKRVEPQEIGFETSTDRIAMYDKFGTATFMIESREITLSIYQSHDSRRNPLYRNHLFLPFYDMTNGQETYGGGRYIDLRIPKGDQIIIDFNQAYFPYCAYSDGYSCPVPPVENYIEYKIEAGVKNFPELQKLK